MQSYVSQNVKIGKSKNGKGLFAIKKIPKGEIIIDYTKGPGKFIPEKEAERLYRKGNDYMIQTGDDSFFASTNKKELEDADFINHSCNPNCGIQGSLRIVSIRAIRSGEEITFDYAMSESAHYNMKCSCGFPNCRGIITGNDWKLKSLQKKYLGFFSTYIQKKILSKNP